MNILKKSMCFLLLAALIITSFPSVILADEASQLTNYALDCEVRSCVSGEKTPVSNVIDGDMSTDWSTYTSTRKGCVEFSLSEPAVLNKVTVVNGTSVGRNITVSVQTSPDGYDWYYRQKDIRIDSKATMDIFFEDTLCEYVKLSVTDVEIVSSKYYGFSIAEIGLYYDTNSDTSKLLQSIQSAENLVAKFKSANPDEVQVPDGAFEELQEYIDSAKALVEGGGVSQYVIDKELSALDGAMEAFIGKITYADSVFEAILEGQKKRQIDTDANFADANDVWTTMNKTSDADMLWPHTWETANAESGFLVDWGDNFYKMTRAYLMKSANQGNKELLKDIEYGLNWTYENKYNENIKQYGNWWHWSIGAPKRYIYTMIALKDELSEETISKMCNAIKYWLGDFWNSSGANRTDSASIAIGVAAFMKDGQYLYRAQQCILDDLVYQEDGGTGHYKDGSYLYHQGLSYNGNYGKELLKSVSSILMMTAGTPLQVDDYYINALKSIAENGYDPLVYKGHFTYAARGRQIYGTNRATDVGNILSGVSECLQEPDKTLVKSLSMKMKQEAGTGDVLADSNWNTHKRYAAMDRTAHLNDNFGFYLSTYSPRTKMFEAVNGEDMLGWYSSAGMFYLETDDKTYYDDGYMQTLDWYRLPGTTVDSVMRTNKRWGGESYNQYEFVGGAGIDTYGIEAMEFGLPYTDLHGRKSYFMFDDEIVFLGSDITETSGNTVETIIDNRKISNNNTNRLVINGAEKSTALGKVKQFVPTADPLEEGEDVPRGEELSRGYSENVNASWIYLDDNTGSGIGNGYVFPKRTSVNVKREERTGCEAVTQFAGDRTEVSRNWVTMWIDHGINPEKASYEWVMLPQKSQAEVEAYAGNPHITVVENSSEVQAVRENKLGILGVNSYAENGSTVEGISVDRPASYMVRETGNYYEISVSQPIRTMTEKIHFELKADADTVLMKDNQIENVSFDGSSVSFDVDVSDGSGNDYHIILGKNGIFTGLHSEAFANSYMQIGNTTAIAAHKTCEITAPVMKNDVTYAPLRFVAESLGARVSWDDKTSRVQIITDSHVAIMQIDSNVMTIDGKKINVDSAPEVTGGVTLVPLRVLAEAIGAEVNWHEDGKIIEVVSDGGSSYIEETATVFSKLR